MQAEVPAVDGADGGHEPGERNHRLPDQQGRCDRRRLSSLCREVAILGRLRLRSIFSQFT